MFFFAFYFFFFGFTECLFTFILAQQMMCLEPYCVPAYWPSNTENESLLVAENLVIKYAPDPLTVLHDVSFTLKAGE